MRQPNGAPASVDPVENYTGSDEERWVAEPAKNPNRTSFERDRARVVHSSALRRLGAKTQVLGPESDDFIRTRLTHSLEVAQIGRSLAKNFHADQDIVEAACLAHDLGHPPFGHNGESALAEVAKGIGGFEGNAQTLRILTRLEPKRLSTEGRVAGLNLTRATLDATIKYPWGAGEGPLRRDGSRTRKFNVYEDDRPVYTWIRDGHGPVKSAEAQMMDLSDDIAYSVHDVEDAVVRGYVDLGRFQDGEERDRVVEMTKKWYLYDDVAALDAAFDRLVSEEQWPGSFTGTYEDLAEVKNLTSDLIGRFISAVVDATKAARGDAPLTRYTGDVVVPAGTAAEILILKGIAVEYVMEPRAHTPQYLEQRTLIFNLVDALLAHPENLEPHIYQHWRGADEATQLRLVVDQVASLTDQSARQWHARLVGMLR
ncbi:deoxyguanosinetriphosphate triphosphohydrolase [Neoactinobaculum massilliense]|uniref:deoxyguanosinetriphosphate triphosphohydrolase n=1 Tax=Neoactinobaculum massilliense TaxID=2364794 RepID=UPI000F53E96A